MLPSIFGENLFDDFFGDPFVMMPRGRDPLYGKHARNLMRTDVRETEDSYELDVDLPGFKKDEVTLELKDGCLTTYDQAYAGRNRRYYQITEHGRAALRQHRIDWQNYRSGIDTIFFGGVNK